MPPWAILVNWRPRNGILRFLLPETSLILSEMSSAGTETEMCYIPTGNYWEGITVSRHFSFELVCTSLSQTIHRPRVTLPVPARSADVCFFSIPTVIQGVDIALLGLNNQSFARLMEQRLAPLFMMSHQQGRRFRRATTVGSYTVQVLNGPVLKEVLCLHVSCFSSHKNVSD